MYYVSTAALPDCDVEDWRSHPRLLRHLRKFQRHPDQAKLLHTYLHQTKSLERKELLRHTVHVAAWVALLPMKKAQKAVGAKGVSAVLVLARLLQRCGNGFLTPWLSGVLELVALVLQDALASSPSSSCEGADHWTELQQSMREKVFRRICNAEETVLQQAPRCTTFASAFGDTDAVV